MIGQGKHNVFLICSQENTFILKKKSSRNIGPDVYECCKDRKWFSKLVYEGNPLNVSVFTLGPCCSNDTCRVVHQWTRCREATDCKFDGRCDGRTWTCAPSVSRPDNTTCASGTMVCSNGYCNGSICLLYGFKGCMCENKVDQCKVCCMNGGKCMVATNISSVCEVICFHIDIVVNLCFVICLFYNWFYCHLCLTHKNY